MKYLFLRSLSPGKNYLFCILGSPGLYHLFWEKMGLLENVYLFSRNIMPLEKYN